MSDLHSAESEHSKVVAWYVSDGKRRYDFDSYDKALKRWAESPYTNYLGEWIETRRKGPMGIVRSRRGNLIANPRQVR